MALIYRVFAHMLLKTCIALVPTYRAYLHFETSKSKSQQGDVRRTKGVPRKGVGASVNMRV